MLNLKIYFSVFFSLPRFDIRYSIFAFSSLPRFNIRYSIFDIRFFFPSAVQYSIFDIRYSLFSPSFLSSSGDSYL